MRFSPKTAAEIDAEKAKFAAWSRGNYDFEVVSAEDSTSKNGNDMIVVELLVFDQHGNKKKIKDWLVEAMPVKLKHMCEATGLHSEYDEGNFTSDDLLGRTGKVTLAIEKNEQYGDRNKVYDYVPAPRPEGRVAAKTRPAVQARPANSGRSGGPSWDAPKGVDLDDEMPF